MAKVALTESEKQDLAYLKDKAEKTLYQEIDKNGSDELEDWFISCEGELTSLREHSIVAVYGLVGFARVDVKRTTKLIE